MQGGEIFNELALFTAELAGDDDIDADLEVATSGAAQSPNSTVLYRDDISTLGTGLDLDARVSVESGELCRGTEQGIGQGHVKRAQQIVAVTTEDVIVQNPNLEVQITVRAAGLTSFASAGEV